MLNTFIYTRVEDLHPFNQVCISSFHSTQLVFYFKSCAVHFPVSINGCLTLAERHNHVRLEIVTTAEPPAAGY